MVSGSKKENIVNTSAGVDKKNQLYPVFLKLDQLELLLVGAGNVGGRLHLTGER